MLPKKKYLIIWGKRVVSAVVLLAVAYTAFKSLQQLDDQAVSIQQLDLRWIFGAAVLYAIGLGLAWSFWHIMLHAIGQKPNLDKSSRAFVYSQLAKYVPGKAMVLVVRASCVSDEKVKAEAAVVSVFFETFTWMMSAAGLALMVRIFFMPQDIHIPSTALEFSLWISAGATLLFFALSFPPFFRRMIGFAGTRKFWDANKAIRSGISIPVWILGVGILSLGWFCLATSLWMVLNALPENTLVDLNWSHCLIVVTLASVVGFLSFIPAGLGVRELVMIPMLGPVVGAGTAICAPIILRLLWISVELFLAGIFKLQHWFSMQDSN
ncbi:MAG TPA: lysylphosphatidylglycerol synthase transmembrane domain-containing protein [Pirellulaceae bacterium]|nr:lysylphosphatidylglycerol synthase transmembrane domain-containing protein [Pirellulaceae bacterium]HMO91774.1 lysylphosphatidylglycerol synthase transmembrane domain-containing protein [Pirellulaceae bacterium]HMP69573.1 lysylphosphatidylglycerol synthase transmembrane domain-containing protein [Pirellulaceae bacterium]